MRFVSVLSLLLAVPLVAARKGGEQHSLRAAGTAHESAAAAAGLDIKCDPTKDLPAHQATEVYKVCLAAAP